MWRGQRHTEYVCGSIAKAIKDAEKLSRKTSRKYRMAWSRTGKKYQCAHCKELLHPDSFDCDHVSELQDGGEDVMAEPTRAVLKLSCQEDAQSRQKETQALVIDAKVRLLFYVRFFAPKTLAEPLENLS